MYQRRDNYSVPVNTKLTQGCMDLKMTINLNVHVRPVAEVIRPINNVHLYVQAGLSRL